MIISGEKKSGSIWELFKKLVLELLRKWKNWKINAVQKLRELNNWEWRNFPDKRRKVNLQWTSLRFRLRNYKIKWTLWTIPGISMIVRRQTGLSHLVIAPSLRGVLSRDACLQPDTRNLCGTSGNVFENPLAPNEPTASCLGNVCARSFSATHCELASPNTRRSVANMAELERHTQNFAKLAPRFVRKFFTWNPPSHAESLSA